MASPNRLSNFGHILLFCALFARADLTSAQWSEQVLENFGPIWTPAGRNPNGPLCLGKDGALYGSTANDGGMWDFGILFKINRDGTGFTVLHQFDSHDPSGGLTPSGNLLQASDGLLYGVANYPPAKLFKLNTDGTGFSILHTFTGPTERTPSEVSSKVRMVPFMVQPITADLMTWGLYLV